MEGFVRRNECWLQKAYRNVPSSTFSLFATVVLGLLYALCLLHISLLRLSAAVHGFTYSRSALDVSMGGTLRRASSSILNRSHILCGPIVAFSGPWLDISLPMLWFSFFQKVTMAEKLF